MNTNEVAVATLACLAIGLAAGAAAAPPKPGQPKEVQAQPAGPAAALMRPDLVVQKIWVTGTHPNPGGGTRVDIHYTVANTSMIDSWKTPTSDGIRFWFDHLPSNQQVCSAVDMRELPNGVFPLVPEPIECLTKLGGGASHTCSGGVDVPAGKTVEIRATVDPRNWIEERNEGNNSKTLIWPTVTPTPVSR